MYRKLIVAATAAIFAAGAVQAAQPKSNSYYPANKTPLTASAFSFLPLGSVKPQGWLKQQLQIQASGLTGHLPDFWKDLGPDSGWLGGNGESWERGPYYMDGMVPLAFLLDDPKLLEMAHKWVGWTLDNQRPNGAIGPEKCTDWWPLGLMCKVLTQYHDATNDPRVIPVLERFFKYMATELPNRPLHEWAKMRWADTAVSVIWLYNRNGDPALLELGRLLQKQGYDYAYAFNNFDPWKERNRGWTFEGHGVNAGMGIKTPGVMYTITGEPRYKRAAYTGIEVLDRYHGQANGMFAADECLAGKNPSQGTELCAVDEAMFSYENLIQMFGDPALADRLEKITYNAWPATFSPDMWAHQYDQQSNQVMCKRTQEKWFTNNGGEANLFGIEPQFGCCTANMHQGWPKFVRHMWMATPEDGLAAVAYGPCAVTATVRGGSTVTIETITDYPFSDVVKMTVKTARPVTFPLQLRVPAWAEGASITAAGETIRPRPGTFANVERVWKNGDTVEIKLPMRITVERRFNNSATILRGPLVYALRIGEQWNPIRGEAPHQDFEVLPTTPWNYGLILDGKNPEKSFKVVTRKMTNPVYASLNAPIELHAKGRIVPEWKEEKGGAGLLPVSPVKSTQPVEKLVLIPYGCAKLRVTEFPVLEE